MSIKLMNLAFRNTDLTGNTRLTLLSMADNASDEGYCWPSYATIAKKVNVTRRSAMRLIIKLEKLGYLTREVRYKDGKREHTSNGFYLNRMVMKATAEVVTEESLPGVASVTTVVTGVSPKPPIEPPFKQFEEEEALAKLSKLYTNNLGMITPVSQEWLKDAAGEYPSDWFEPALKEMLKNNVRTWNYWEAILKRWKRDGFQSDSRPKKKGSASGKEARMKVYEEFIAQQEEE